MSYNYFGPAYRTTREDRLRRGLIRAEAAVAGAAWAEPSGHNLSADTFPSSSNAIVGTPQQYNNYWRSTPIVPHTLCPPHEPTLEPHVQPSAIDLIDLTDTENLMDIDNTLLENLATVDEVGPTGFIDQLLGQQCSSEYAQVNPQSFRRVTTFREAPFSRNLVGNLREHEVRPCMRPDNQLGRIEMNQASRYLAKTDRLVVLEIIKNVRPVSGSDERELVEFLKQLRPVFEIDPYNSNEVIKLLLPKVTGQLFNLWMRAVTSNANWEMLHTEILNHFLTPMRLRELQLVVVERPQRIDEQFVEYVEDCIMSAFALRVGLSERDVVESVLNRCRPETRHHFTFGRKPNTIEELRHLASKITNTMKADARYFGGSVSNNVPVPYNNMHMPRQNPPYNNMPYPIVPYNNYMPHQNLQNTSFSRPPTHFQHQHSQRIPRPNNVVCHRCGNTGHIARYCNLSLN